MTLEDVFEIFNNSIVHSFDDDLGLFTHMLESFVNFVDVSHEYFHLLCKSRAGGDAAGGHRRHRQPNETLVRALVVLRPYFWNQNVNRSETQYKWTRNYALIFFLSFPSRYRTYWNFRCGCRVRE